MIYEFGSYRLDTVRRELFDNGDSVTLEPQVFDVLRLLIENRDQVVTKDQLIDEVWDGRFIAEATLSARISAARRAVGDNGKDQNVIRTLSKHGFRFVAEAAEIADDSLAHSADPDRLATGIPPDSTPVAKTGRRRFWAVSAILTIVALGLIGFNAYQRTLTGTKVSPIGKPSIAVLPFENMSGDKAQEYFSDGITEDIMTELSKFGYFLVISRNSTFSYKGKSPDAATVLRELGAEYVLEGRVRKMGDRIRVTAQLVDATADKQIWAKRFDRELENVFQVQDEIARSIVTLVAPEYFTAEMQRAQRRETPDLQAWDASMRGYWHYLRFTKSDNFEAKRLLQKAISIDPYRANYHSVLAVSHMIDGLYGWGGSREQSLDMALKAAERGLALDEQDAQVIRTVGVIHFFSRRHEIARDYYERAVSANPYEAENHALLGAALGVEGDYEGALEAFKLAFQLSPRDVHIATWYNYLAIAAFVVGNHHAAVEWAEKTTNANPTFPGGYRSLAASLGVLGQLKEAKQAGKKLLALLPNLTIGHMRESLPYFVKESDLERYLEGLTKAGIPE